MLRPLRHLALVLAVLVPLAFSAATAGADHDASFLNTLAATPSITASTVPSNGDQNPYGVAVVPRGFPSDGALRSGDILVSNFNNGRNQQGTGTTIVAVRPSGSTSTFFSAPSSLAPVGLTTALVALRSGLVVVGNTPTTDGTTATIANGSLIFLDEHASVQLNLVDSSLLQGPWDLTADDSNPSAPILYVSNVLSGTVTRINLDVVNSQGHPTPVIESLTTVGSGFMHRTDPNALVVGPTGLLLAPDRQTLYVADTGNNRIQALRGVRDTHEDLHSGQTVLSGAPLKGPLALAWTPLGTIVASNGDAAGSAATPPNMVVEFDPRLREVVATRQLDRTMAGTPPSIVPGAVFGIAIAPVNGTPSLIYANDNTTTVDVLPPAR
jgi:hypothetical protein